MSGPCRFCCLPLTRKPSESTKVHLKFASVVTLKDSCHSRWDRSPDRVGSRDPRCPTRRPHSQIGCMHGIAASQIAVGLTTGKIIAIDRSPKMFPAAIRRNEAHIGAGRVEILQVIGCSSGCNRSMPSTCHPPLGRCREIWSTWDFRWNEWRSMTRSPFDVPVSSHGGYSPTNVPQCAPACGAVDSAGQS